MVNQWNERQLQHWLNTQPWYPVVQHVGVALQAEVAVVGGLLRDAFWLGEPGNDVDLVVAGCPAETFASALATQLNGRLVTLDQDYGIYRVIYWPLVRGACLSTQQPAEETEPQPTQAPMTLDVAAAQTGRGVGKGSVIEDLARRDLTVNALAWRISGGIHHLPMGLLDTHNGWHDLQRGRLRFISERNVQEDPLRVLRLFRVLVKLPGAWVEPQSLLWASQAASQLQHVAGERLQMEWLKLLAAVPQSLQGVAPFEVKTSVFEVLQALTCCGVMEILLPEVTACSVVPPNSHHHLPLLAHTLELLRQLEGLFGKLPEAVQSHLLQSEGQGSNRLALVRWGCLLHDIGKPATWEIETDEATGEERHRFLGHEAVGERMCSTIANRFKTSDAVKQRLKHLVRWHLYPCQFTPASSEKSVLRFFRRMGEEALDVTVLALADRLSTCGPAISAQVLEEAEAAHYWLMNTYLERKALWQAPPLVNGREVMALLNCTPGPQVGKALAALREVQQLGQVTSKEEAIAFLRHHNQ
jgi:putative nucleotidyltransferase with HDIG domain